MEDFVFNRTKAFISYSHKDRSKPHARLSCLCSTSWSQNSSEVRAQATARQLDALTLVIR